MDPKEFFIKLINTPSPTGFEEKVQAEVRQYAGAFADKITIDVHGNLIAVRNPDAPYKIMMTGHCDQLGLLVQYIDGDGYISALQLGGWDPQTLIGQRVTIWGEKGPVYGVIGRKAIHLLNEEERRKVPRVNELWIDIGAKDGDQAKEFVQVGDCVTMELAYQELLNNRLSAVATDDKTGVWVVMEALRRIDPAKLSVGVYAVSTVQEEVGLRGARTSAFGIDPQVGIAVDVTHATDCPTIDKKANGDIVLGEGAVISIGPNMNRKLTQKLLNISAEQNIKTQRLAEGRITGTDAAMLQVNRSGVATALVSIPNRYMHTPVEVVSWDDMNAAADLLTRYCESVKPDESYIPGLD